MTYDNCLHDPEGKLIYLFLTPRVHFFALSHSLRSNSFDIKGFLLLLSCCIVYDAFANSIHEMNSHHIPITTSIITYNNSLFSHPLSLYAKKERTQKLFHLIRIKGKIWGKRQKMRKKKKSFSFLMLLSNAAADTWYGEKVLLTKQKLKGSERKKRWKPRKDRNGKNYIRFATINRLLRAKAFGVNKGEEKKFM